VFPDGIDILLLADRFGRDVRFFRRGLDSFGKEALQGGDAFVLYDVESVGEFTAATGEPALRELSRF
jgi:hypothetical protein